MVLTRLMATRLGRTLTDVRKNGESWWLRPDGKKQVTIEYNRNLMDQWSRRSYTQWLIISTQHAEPLKAQCTEEVQGYTGEDATAPSMKEMNE